jgi:hypothetical protein
VIEGPSTLDAKIEHTFKTLFLRNLRPASMAILRPGQKSLKDGAGYPSSAARNLQ